MTRSLRHRPRSSKRVLNSALPHCLKVWHAFEKRMVLLRLSRTACVIALVLAFGLSACASSEQRDGGSLGSAPTELSSAKDERGRESVKTGSVADNTQGDKSPAEDVPVDIGAAFDASGRYEITLASGEWVDEVLPPDTSSFYNYYERKEGMSYFVVRGTLKNVSSQPSKLGSGSNVGLSCTYRFNDTYEVSADVVLEDGNRFEREIGAMETKSMVIFASVSNEIKDAFTGCKATLRVNEETYDVGAGVWRYPNDGPVGLYSGQFA